jgi:asparagine synthase (glutamine-hydrolysing)
MCGIGAFIQLIKNQPNYEQLFADFMSMKPRGPDMTNFQIIKNLTLVFHRLAVMNPTFNGNQPYFVEDGERTIVFICNGEIYDFKNLIKEHDLPIYNNSDCMTIPQLYIKYVKYNPTGNNDISDFTELFRYNVKGEFAFLLFEFDKLQNLKEIIVARDSFGVRPLYFGTNSQSMIFASEIKGMLNYKGKVSEFEPGTIMHYHFDNFGKIEYKDEYDFNIVYDIIPGQPKNDEIYLKNLKEAVINSIKRRLVADVPVGFLLSGGLDSSLVSAVSAKLLGVPIKTFCCSLKGQNEGTDLKFARKVAAHINSEHTDVFFTEEEGCAAIYDVIKTIESYDTTSVRASIPQYLVSKYIGTKTNCKVLCTGEGSDEINSGYMFNYYAPSPNALHECCKEYVKKIHLYDGRRCDRCISRWSLEARVPLLDPEVVLATWKIPPSYRHPKYKNCEKYWLRKAFDGTGILPDEVLWRRKEAFSDGVSGERSWYQIIQDYIDTQVSDEEFELLKYECTTKEQYYYKKIFVKIFGDERLDILPGYWLPKWDSNGNELTQYMDPSARVLSVYNQEN